MGQLLRTINKWIHLALAEQWVSCNLGKTRSLQISRREVSEKSPKGKQRDRGFGAGLQNPERLSSSWGGHKRNLLTTGPNKAEGTDHRSQRGDVMISECWSGKVKSRRGNLAHTDWIPKNAQERLENCCREWHTDVSYFAWICISLV